MEEASKITVSTNIFEMDEDDSELDVSDKAASPRKTKTSSKQVEANIDLEENFDEYSLAKSALGMTLNDDLNREKLQSNETPKQLTKKSRSGKLAKAVCGPASFKRRIKEAELLELSESLNISENSSFTSKLSPDDIVTESLPIQVEKRIQISRPGPARYKRKLETERSRASNLADDSNSFSGGSVQSHDTSIKSLTLGYIPFKKTDSPSSAANYKKSGKEAVLCKSCVLWLPDAEALKHHDRLTHKPCRIAHHLKIKGDTKNMDAKKTKVVKEFKCFQCMNVFPEDDYIQHLVSHDKEKPASRKKISLKPETSQLRTIVYVDLNDERNNNPEAVLRCALCPRLLFLEEEDLCRHVRNEHNLVVE